MEETQPTLRRVLKLRFRDSRKRRGLLGAIAAAAREGIEFVRDSTPSRLRQRWGDVDFDCDFGVDTTSARLPARTRLFGAVTGGPYQPSEPALFHKMLESPSINYSQFVFIDLGSGKGRALLLASDYPFRRILGVELLPELHRIAEENIKRYGSPRQRCTAIESVCGDALEFQFPPEPAVLYIFNPFPESGLAKVVGNLERWLASSPRPVYVIYHNPILEHLMSGSPHLRRIAGTHQFAIFGRS